MLAWFMFQLGQVMHVVSQIDQIARAKNNTATSRKQILLDRLVPIIVRSFIATIAFGVLLGGGLPKILEMVGMQSPSWVITLSVLLSQTGMVGASLAAAVGFGADSALTLVPAFKSYIPPPIDDQK